MNGNAPKAPLKITEVTFGKTINIGEYESIRIDLKAQVGPDEDWREVLQRLRVTVNKLDPHFRQDRC